MKIYTKTGDKGTTRLVDGSCVEKHNPRVEAYGCLDELNSLIGWTLMGVPSSAPANASGAGMFSVLLQDLREIQSDLFILGSLFACEKEETFKKLAQIEESHSLRLEKRIDEFQSELPELKNFILPGGHEFSARLHVCRTACRRAERRASEILMKDSRYQQGLIYLNRLSDYLFVAARLVNFRLKIEDPIWRSPLREV